MHFVPAELRGQASPCRLIPLTAKGETADYFYRCGTQMELEEALANWLRDQIGGIEEQRAHASQTKGVAAGENRQDGFHIKQQLAFASNLYLLASRHRDNDDYAVAHALYGRALEAAEKVARTEDGRSLMARIRNDQQAVFGILRRGEDGSNRTKSEELQAAGWWD
jgi:hypothetical protein